MSADDWVLSTEYWVPPSPFPLSTFPPKMNPYVSFRFEESVQPAAPNAVGVMRPYGRHCRNGRTLLGRRRNRGFGRRDIREGPRPHGNAARRADSSIFADSGC